MWKVRCFHEPLGDCSGDLAICWVQIGRLCYELEGKDEGARARLEWSRIDYLLTAYR